MIPHLLKTAGLLFVMLAIAQLVIGQTNDQFQVSGTVTDASGATLSGVSVTVKGSTQSAATGNDRSEEHTSELQSLMRNSYAVFCLKKKRQKKTRNETKNSTRK